MASAAHNHQPITTRGSRRQVLADISNQATNASASASDNLNGAAVNKPKNSRSSRTSNGSSSNLNNESTGVLTSAAISNSMAMDPPKAMGGACRRNTRSTAGRLSGQ